MPGRQADPSRWNLDPKTGWVPPGQSADRSRMQYTLPPGMSPDQIPNWHLLSSPAGTPAPRDLVNYTKGSGKGISPIGTQAPVDQMNHSMLPSKSPAPTLAGSSPPSGVGAGQAAGDGTDPATTDTSQQWWSDPSTPATTDAAPQPSTPASAGDQGPVQGPGLNPTRTQITTRPDPNDPSQTQTTTTTTFDPAKPHQLKWGPAGEAYITDDSGTWVRAPGLDDPRQSNKTDSLKPHNNPDGTVTWYDSTGPKFTDGTPKQTKPSNPNVQKYTAIGDDGQPHQFIATTGPDGQPVTYDMGPAPATGAGQTPWRVVTDSKTGAQTLVNETTGDSKQISPAAPQSTYLGPGQSLVTVDPSTGQPTSTYTAPGAKSFQVEGNQYGSFDPSTGQFSPQGNVQQPQSFETVGNQYGSYDPSTGKFTPEGNVQQNKSFQTVGNEFGSFDPSTGQFSQQGTLPTQLSQQTLTGPGGEQTLIGIDPYTGQPTAEAHQTGGPYEVGHQVFYPSDWTGDSTSYDIGTHQLSQTHHQGTPWSPPPSMRAAAPSAQQAPAPMPQRAAPQAQAAPQPQAQPQPQQPQPQPQQPSSPLLAPGMAGTAQDPNIGPTLPSMFPMTPPTPPPFAQSDQPEGSQRGNVDIGAGQGDEPHNMPRYDINPWTGAPYSSPEGSEVSTGFSGGQEGGAGSTRAYDNQSFGVLRNFPRMREWNISPDATGTGQAVGAGAAPPQQDGQPWSPPINPQQVVGTGHKFGEPVSIEGIHKGVDLQAYRGTPARSPVDGVVTAVDNNPKGLGITVTIRDAQGHETKLGHLGSVTVKPGDKVKRGQPVATVGSTGASTGPHLDVREQDQQGKPIDPTAKLGMLAQLPRADNGMEPGEATPMPDIPQQSVGGGQDVGVGGVYVQFPDGSMHWDETKADPNDAGGSVLSSATGQPIPGANRQSGPTGPGGTGPPGSQARQGHIAELAANPTFRSGSSGVLGLWSGSAPSAAQSPYGTMFGSDPSWGNPGQQQQQNNQQAPGLRTLSTAAPYPNSPSNPTNPWTPPTGALGTGQDVGVGVTSPVSGNFQIQPPSGGSGNIDPFDQENIDYLFQQLQAQAQQASQQLQQQVAAENNRHQEAMAAATTSQQQQAENTRHDSALEQFQAAQANLQTATQYGLQSQAFQQQVATSALQNPWLQRLTGMSPGYGQPGGPGGSSANPGISGAANGETFGQIVQNAANPNIPQLGLPPNWQGNTQPQSNPYLNNTANSGTFQGQTSDIRSALQHMLGSNFNSAQFDALAGSIGNKPNDSQANMLIQVGSNNSLSGLDAIAGAFPQGTYTPAPTGQSTVGNAPQQQQNMPWMMPQSMSMSPQNMASGQTGGSQQPNLSFQDFSNMSPFQLAAWQTDVAGQGPGQWQNTQDSLLNQWGQQGITAPTNSTQMSWDQGGPMGQMQKTDQAEFFGQTGANWLGGQQQNWAKANAPQTSAVT